MVRGGGQGWSEGGGRNHSRSYSASALPGHQFQNHSSQQFNPQSHLREFGSPPLPPNLPYGYPPQPPPVPHGGFSSQNGGYGQYPDRSYGRELNPIIRRDSRSAVDDRRSRDHGRSESDRHDDRHDSRGREQDRRGGDDRRHHDGYYRDRSQGNDSRSYRR